MGNLIETPKIDLRSVDDVVERLRKLILNYTNAWKDKEALEDDAQADAFINIYANMIQVLIERLNKLPDKNHLEFLDMLGVQPIAQKAARVPVTFDLLDKSPKKLIVIPQKTQVAVEKSSDNKPLLFETEEEFVIIRPNLEKAYNVDGLLDRWAELREDIFNVDEANVVSLFKGNELIPHRFFIGDRNALGFATPTQLVVQIELNNNNQDMVFDGEVKWYCYVEDLDEAVELKIEKVADNYDSLKYNHIDLTSEEVSNIKNLLKSGFIQFEDIYHTLAEKQVSGIAKFVDEDTDEITYKQRYWNNFYIYAELDDSIAKLHKTGENGFQKKNLDFPEIKNINLITKPLQASDDTKADILFYNNVALDSSKAVYPFGSNPKYNDTFYIGSKDVFAKEGSTVTITITKASNQDNPQTDSVTLLWEFFDGMSWQELGYSGKDDMNSGTNTGNEAYNFLDETRALTWSNNEASDNDGEVTFTCPAIEETSINGKKNLYIRARIVGGNYSKEVDEVYSTTTGNTTTTSTIKVIKQYPPVFESITMNYQSLPVKKIPDEIFTYNDFLYKDITNPEVDETAATENSYKKSLTFKKFIPFLASEEKSTMFYFNFSEEISELPINLFISLANSDDEALSLISTKDTIGLTLEYFNGYVWKPITFLDNTENLTQQGTIFFYTPYDIQPSIKFGESSYWLRIQYQAGGSRYFPKIDGLYINTSWCKQAITVENEILGSSNGLKKQVYTFANGPVMDNQEIYILDKTLTADDVDTIRTNEGDDAVIEIENDVENYTERWVKWYEVPYFLFSDNKSRHYVIDRFNNKLTFGDGIKGMLPPVGRNNIKAKYYQFGGGERGNIKKGDISKLRSSIPFVGSVFNVIASSGGRDLETVEQLQARGSEAIKFEQRLVTAGDFEAMVKVFPQKLSKIKAFSNTGIYGQFNPGFITLLILANSDDEKPLIDLETLKEVIQYVKERSIAFLNQTGMDQINIITPKFVKMNIVADVIVTKQSYRVGRLNLIENKVGERLRDFFHPVTGGQKSEGWEFGECVPVSEIVSEIEQTEGVDSVSSVVIKPSMQQILVKTVNKKAAISPYPEQSFVKIGDYQQYLTAKEIEKNTEIDNLILIGFKEEDEVYIRNINDLTNDDTLTLKIESISIIEERDPDTDEIVNIYNKLKFEPVDILDYYPIGSTIKTIDGRIQSYITDELEKRIIGSSDIENTLELSIATPYKEKVYYLTDDFNDDDYDDLWDENFLPSTLSEFEGFSEPDEFDTYPLNKEPHVIALDDNKFLMVYIVRYQYKNIARVMIGQLNVDDTNDLVSYTEPQSITLGETAVKRHYYVWVRRRKYYSYKYYYYKNTYATRRVTKRSHYSSGSYGGSTYSTYRTTTRSSSYGIRSSYGSTYQRRTGYYYYLTRERRSYYDYIPVEMGYISLVKLSGKKFAICFSDQKNNHKGYVMVGDYTSLIGDDNNIISSGAKIVFGGRVEFAPQALKVSAAATNDGTNDYLTIAYKKNDISESNYYKVTSNSVNTDLYFKIGKINDLNYDKDSTDYNYYVETYYYTDYSNRSYFQNLSGAIKVDCKDSSGVYQVIESIDIQNISYNKFAVCFHNSNGNGYVKIFNSNLSTSMDLVSSISFLDEGYLNEMKLELITDDNPGVTNKLTDKLAVIYIVKDEESSDMFGKVTLLKEQTISGVTGWIKEITTSDSFSTSSTINNLRLGQKSWVQRYDYKEKDGSSTYVTKTIRKNVFLIGFRDYSNMKRGTVVRAEIEYDSNGSAKIDFNQQVVVTSNKSNYFNPVVFRDTNDSTYDEPVNICGILTSSKKGYTVVGTELSLFGRASHDEERYVREKNGYLTIDTGVAYENTPKRFYLINSKNTFTPQSFSITLEATIGSNVEANYSILLGLFDDIYDLREEDKLPYNGIQLRVDRILTENSFVDDTTGEEGDDLHIMEKVVLINGINSDDPNDVDSGSAYKSYEELPDNTLIAGMRLFFSLEYDIVTKKMTGKIIGRDEDSEVFQKELELENVIFTKSTTLAIGVANLLDPDPTSEDDPNKNDYDIDIKSRAEVYIDLVDTNLEIKPFKNYSENSITLINKNDTDVYEVREKGEVDFSITIGENSDKMNKVYLDNNNIVYSGTHEINAEFVNTEEGDE